VSTAIVSEKTNVDTKTIRSFTRGWRKKYKNATGSERIVVARNAVRQRANVSMREFENNIMFSSSVIKCLLCVL